MTYILLGNLDRNKDQDEKALELFNSWFNVKKEQDRKILYEQFNQMSATSTFYLYVELEKLGYSIGPHNLPIKEGQEILAERH